MRIAVATATPALGETLRRALSLAPAYDLAWSANNGMEAILRAAVDPPALVLLDLELTSTEPRPLVRLMLAACPCAILLVGDNVQARTAEVFDAMGQGALDAIDVPPGGLTTPRTAAPLRRKIETLLRLLGSARDAKRARTAAPERRHAPPLVAIGASAGGPAAVADVLRDLPHSFPAAVVIVQHVDAQFARGMCAWLAAESGVPVDVAIEGDRPRAGRVLMAGAGQHLMLTETGVLSYTPEPRNAVYCPSIDVFFQSLLRGWRGPIVGVLLTGMGRDGAAGLKALRARGHHTIAQDETTCAVYGMPRAAVDLGAAVDVLPTDRIARRLTEVLGVEMPVTKPEMYGHRR